PLNRNAHRHPAIFAQWVWKSSVPNLRYSAQQEFQCSSSQSSHLKAFRAFHQEHVPIGLAPCVVPARLGLILQLRQGEREILVIDRIERPDPN
ncbi:MAG: hypothetical protein ABI995_15075, partial [Acidobacteriota bacterium]